MKVYFISGLAADSRVFKYIQLPEGFEIVHLDWVLPLKNESLAGYAGRLAENIVPGEPYVLLGLSMGGMIVSEIAKQCKKSGRQYPALSILVSSVPVSAQLPTHFKLARFLRLNKLVPVGLLKSASMLKRLMAPDTNEDKQLLMQVVKDSDPVFIRWALEAVLKWENDVVPDTLLHIHGSRDNVLPARYTSPTHIIKNGSHLMVMGRAPELNALIEKSLQAIQQ